MFQRESREYFRASDFFSFPLINVFIALKQSIRQFGGKRKEGQFFLQKELGINDDKFRLIDQREKLPSSSKHCLASLRTK